MKLNSILIGGFLFVVVLFTSTGYFSFTTLDKIAAPLHNEVPESIAHITKDSNLDALARFIQYYDEVLTQSARNYAFTQDKKWEQRYRDTEPELDRTIKEAIKKGDEKDQEFFSSVDVANLALVEMEYNAIDYINEGQPEKAIEILESDEYWKQKDIYKQGLINYVTRRGKEYDEALSASTETLSLVTEQTRNSIVTSKHQILIILSATSILLIFFGFFTSYSISKPIKELHRATEQIEKGNFKTQVDIKTSKELTELGKTFNKTTAALGKLDEERKQLDSAKTQFLSITSHELRSPMTPMKAQLQLLEQGYLGKLTKQQKESLNISIRNADRLDTIIADFLEISRMEAARLKFKFTKTDLKKTVQDVALYMRSFMPEKNIKIVTNLQPLPIIEADPDRISQILRNLINNALKFSKPNTTIQVAAEAQQNHILFSVKDQGIGVSDQDKKRLFEPFFQAEQTIYREQGGTGLGLAICRGIVLAQDGRIWLESQLGKGTTFYFTLPREPVREPKPIKILFSPQEGVEKYLRKLFQETLGPIGKSEFDILQEQKMLDSASLHNYVDSIEKKNVIDKPTAVTFKKMINEVIK